ncbi:putative nucleoporin nup49 [Golovinomyces cichoracearum]|uniref:Putative nucleoporin nup49 n=1 Tax=Golovinomyces cichoracearum TaxID=62708 RepID=A0A420JAP4_9PEZI|nr:putative nucleoporin nup49 [Golovinomyces cichoracearum]
MEEMSALEYARLNGLSWDYKAERSGLLELERIKFIDQMRDTNTLDDSHLSAFEFGPEMRVEERLIISKEAALLIQSVARSDGSDPATDLNLFSSGEKRTSKEFRLELPLLHSDHEKDCRDFGNKENFEIKIQDVKLPLEVLDEEKNRGLTWSSELWNSGPELIKKIKLERFCVSKETLSYLQEILRKDSWTVEDAKSMWINEQTYQKAKLQTYGRNLVTPPLSPRESSPEPYQPSSSDSLYQIPLLSDPSSPTDQELKKLESGIFKRDVPTPIRDSTLLSYSKEVNNIDHVRIGDLYSPLESLDDPDYLDLIEAPRVKRESLRVDETLTPQASTTKQIDSIELKTLAEEQMHDVGDYLGFEDKMFDDVFLPAYEVAIQNVEQEDLVEVDATCRVNIPNMDFSKGESTWKTFESAAKDPIKLLNLQKSFMRECFGVYPAPWTSSAKIESKLRWDPFPQDTIDILFKNEKFEPDDSILKIFIPEIESLGIIDSSGSVWKRPGLRISRDNEESEHEIEYHPLVTKIPCNTGPNLKKRKAELDEKTQQIPNNAADFGVSLIDLDSYSQFKDLKQRNQGKKHNLSGLLLDEGFSACSAVENFLETRGTKILKTTKSSYFDTNNSKKSVNPDLDREKLNATTLESHALPSSWQAMLPVISIDKDQSRNVVIASKIFAKRLLIKTVEKLLPKINIVERDFSIHNSIAWTRGSVIRSPVLSPISCEADVIISPVTGVILTTLQKIKQKPLPGQKSQSALRELMISISLRYEKIIVLVSEDRVDESTIGLDARDCLAWSEFVGFTISLDSLIIPKFIGGGQETLAQWLVSYIAKYSTNGPVILQDETNWEIFLRRAGLNPFAAQAIIADLKAPNNSTMPGKEEGRFIGLVDFVGMSADQRMKRFSHLVGERVIERVSRMIDRKWSN